MCEKLRAANKQSANVDINLENTVVTYKTAAQILMSIIQFLLFNRNQIPFVYETYSQMVTNLEKSRATNEADKTVITNYAVERQRDKAIETYQQLKEISDLVLQVFRNGEIKEAVIAFGATTFTAKEAFVVKFPRISANHTVENHSNSSQTIIRNVILPIITSTQFFDLNCSVLKPTNMFVFLMPKDGSDFKLSGQFQQRNNLKLPTLCRTTLLNINNNTHETELNCCRNLTIFNDFEAPPPAAEFVDMQRNDEITQQENSSTSDNGEKSAKTCDCFYECNIVLKGYKDQLIKGKSIWL